MEENASHYPKLTNGIRDILEDMSKYVVKENTPIIVIDEYSWCVCALSLLAKQINLCDSCVLLLENGMEQEAYLIARSQFNNLLWIKYICEDEDGSRIKEYIYQPNIAQKKQVRKIKDMISQHADEFDERFHDVTFVEKMDNLIADNDRILSEAGVSNLQYKQVFDLAKQNTFLFEMYLTMYNEGSQIEHSDISAVNRYRQKILDEYSDTQIFYMDLSKSDEDVWLKVVGYTLICLFTAFEAFINRINTKEEHLFEGTALSKPMFDKSKFNDIMIKIYACQKFLEELQK